LSESSSADDSNTGATGLGIGSKLGIAGAVLVSGGGAAFAARKIKKGGDSDDTEEDDDDDFDTDTALNAKLDALIDADGKGSVELENV
jgi:hypothetical protein